MPKASSATSTSSSPTTRPNVRRSSSWTRRRSCSASRRLARRALRASRRRRRRPLRALRARGRDARLPRPPRTCRRSAGSEPRSPCRSGGRDHRRERRAGGVARARRRGRLCPAHRRERARGGRLDDDVRVGGHLVRRGACAAAVRGRPTSSPTATYRAATGLSIIVAFGDAQWCSLASSWAIRRGPPSRGSRPRDARRASWRELRAQIAGVGKRGRTGSTSSRRAQARGIPCAPSFDARAHARKRPRPRARRRSASSRMGRSPPTPPSSTACGADRHAGQPRGEHAAWRDAPRRRSAPSPAYASST